MLKSLFINSLSLAEFASLLVDSAKLLTTLSRLKKLTEGKWKKHQTGYSISSNYPCFRENPAHPLINSLEGLQRELTGFHSQSQFKLMHHLQLARDKYGGIYCIVVFTINGLDAIMKELGHEAAQETLRSAGTFINKHFDAIGGFSTRRYTNEFITVLPYTELSEAQVILADFAVALNENGIKKLLATARHRGDSGSCVEFAMMAGLAQGQPDDVIDSAINAATAAQKEIAHYRCEHGR